MGRHQSNFNSLVSTIGIICSSSASEERASPVCGTDRHIYSSVCGLKSTACSEIRREEGNLPEYPTQTGDILPGSLQVTLQGDGAAGPVPGVWKQGHKFRNVCPWLLHLCPDSESPGQGQQWGGDLLPEEVWQLQSAIATKNKDNQTARLLFHVHVRNKQTILYP